MLNFQNKKILYHIYIANAYKFLQQLVYILKKIHFKIESRIYNIEYNNFRL